MQMSNKSAALTFKCESKLCQHASRRVLISPRFIKYEKINSEYIRKPQGGSPQPLPCFPLTASHRSPQSSSAVLCIHTNTHTRSSSSSCCCSNSLALFSAKIERRAFLILGHVHFSSSELLSAPRSRAKHMADPSRRPNAVQLPVVSSAVVRG